MMKAPLAVFVVLLISRLAFAADPKLQQEGTQLIQTAIDKTNIFALPSFVLKAAVTVNSSGKEINGAYELFWNGPDQWREQILFPDYGEIRVGAKGLAYSKRSETLFALEIEALRSALGFGSAPVSRSVSFLWSLPEREETIGKIERRKIRGIGAQCVEVKRKRDQGTFKRTVCISDVNGAILRGEQPTDSDFEPVGSKIFPRTLAGSYGSANARIQITELKTDVVFPQKTFEPSPDSDRQIGCMNPESYSAVKYAAPELPISGDPRNIKGVVYVEAIIGADGVPKNLNLVKGVNSAIDQAIIQGYRNFRFDPAKCGDTPIEAEAVFGYGINMRP